MARCLAVAGWGLAVAACGARISLGALGDGDADAAPDANGGGSPDVPLTTPDVALLDEASSFVDAALEDDSAWSGGDDEGGAVFGDASAD